MLNINTPNAATILIFIIKMNECIRCFLLSFVINKVLYILSNKMCVIRNINKVSCIYLYFQYILLLPINYINLMVYSQKYLKYFKNYSTFFKLEKLLQNGVNFNYSSNFFLNANYH